ncbi:peptidoglycan-binding domain-containing protein [Arenibaculum sp.]|uniref:peptidoglycan-binding domain-containing protein n=1 Tax=Arenibaculum sp. TaxID=2865862 RepID=UPI002E0DD828|nr:peptidoglycan-binding domain-containing protein [Arenibaculum sp.]
MNTLFAALLAAGALSVSGAAQAQDASGGAATGGAGATQTQSSGSTDTAAQGSAQTPGSGAGDSAAQNQAPMPGGPDAQGMNQLPSAGGTLSQDSSQTLGTGGTASQGSTPMPATDTAATGSGMQPDQMSEDDVRKLQQALADQGQDLQVDGVWGPNTETALRGFQEQQGMDATGQPDQETLSALDVELDGMAEAGGTIGTPAGQTSQ